MINYTYVKNGETFRGRCSHVSVRWTPDQETMVILTDEAKRVLDTLNIGSELRPNKVSEFNCDHFRLARNTCHH